MNENKEEICRLLLQTLKATRNLHDLTVLEYVKGANGSEIITAVFEDGYKQAINVTCDSGTAMITDVLKELL